MGCQLAGMTTKRSYRVIYSLSWYSLKDQPAEMRANRLDYFTSGGMGLTCSLMTGG